MTAPSKIEEVARAMCAPTCETEIDVDENWRDWVPEAIAAVRALRNPTEAMSEAGIAQVDPTNPHKQDVADNIWTVMIGAILADTGES